MIVLVGLATLSLTINTLGESENLSTKDRAAVARGIARISQGRELIFVFSPTPTGFFCEQADILAAHAQELHKLDMEIVWLGSHDAGGHSDTTSVCESPKSVDHINVRQMLIEGAGSNDGGASMVYNYFHVDSETFAVLIFGRDGQIRLRSSKPVPFPAISRGMRPSP